MENNQKINPFGLGGAFVQYCVEKEWVILEMTGHEINYYITPEGEKALAENFEIYVTSCMKKD